MSTRSGHFLNRLVLAMWRRPNAKEPGETPSPPLALVQVWIGVDHAMKEVVAVPSSEFP